MRYYNLSLFQPGSTTPIKVWESHPNGVFNPNAQNIEFDVPVVPADTEIGGATITIEGNSLKDLLSAQQYTGLLAQLSGGMKNGLPLANSTQSGVLVSGPIFQSFGNWEGTEMTLDLVVVPGFFAYDNPGNIVLNWPSGTLLSDALQNTLATAFPTLPPPQITIGQITQQHDEVARYSKLEQLATFLSGITSAKGTPVRIVLQGGTIYVTDSTFSPPPKQILPTDLIGQPTWIAPNLMQMKVVMRGDLYIGSNITMPSSLMNAPGIIFTLGSALPSQIKYSSTFSGSFTIIEMRHLGNFRSQDGAQWATIMNCVPNG